jgi:hypothetical protein
MSKQETKAFFAIERQKHFDFFLPFYREKNWQIVEDNIDGINPIDWDVKLEVYVGKYKKVDEKVREGEYGDCLVELMQDIKTKKLGWVFGNKDWVLYGSWANIENIYPSSLYLISMPRLKGYIFSLKGILKTVISHKGWGITWNITLYWDELIEKGVAEKLI